MGHGHDHDHDHDHHGHAHAHVHGGGHGRAFAIGIALNAAFVVAEVIAGVAASSTALLADAAHNIGDVLGLGLAWGATMLAKTKRTQRRTYGLKRTTILAGFANAMIVLFAVGGVAWEAVRRFGDDTARVDGGVVALVALAGVAINGGTALLFARGRDKDVNVRGAYLHLMADAAVSAGVVVAGVLVWRTGLAWIDPATSILVSIVILVGTLRLLRDALDLLLDAVPTHIDPVAVEAYLASLPGVAAVHDLHIWPTSTTEVALTAHLVVTDAAVSPSVRAAADEIEHRFGIAHATLQLEPADAAPCDHCE